MILMTIRVRYNMRFAISRTRLVYNIHAALGIKHLSAPPDGGRLPRSYDPPAKTNIISATENYWLCVIPNLSLRHTMAATRLNNNNNGNLLFDTPGRRRPVPVSNKKR